MTEHLTEEELLHNLKEAKALVEVGGVYTHYRDPKSRYLVTDLAIIEATQEVGVIYRKQTGSHNLQSMLWVRPLHSWLEVVETERGALPRFQKAPLD